MTDFKAKMHQIRFRAGEEEGKGRRRGGRGTGGRERESPQVTVESGPLRALIRHWQR